MDADAQMSRRERQIMDIVYARSEASATHVLEDLHDPPSRTAVRTLLRILAEKGHLRHRKESREYIYIPVRPRGAAGRSALRRVLATFFDGSLEQAVAAHLSDPKIDITPDELMRLNALIRETQEEKI